MVVFIAFYDKYNYGLLLKYADDRKKLNDTWEDWLEQFIKAKRNFDNQFEVIDYRVDVESMQKYFNENKLKNNGSNRAKYVSEKGKEEYEKNTG